MTFLYSFLKEPIKNIASPEERVVIRERKRFPLGKKSEFKESEGRKFKFEGKKIAVFKFKDSFYAITDYCPHQSMIIINIL